MRQLSTTLADLADLPAAVRRLEARVAELEVRLSERRPEALLDVDGAEMWARASMPGRVTRRLERGRVDGFTGSTYNWGARRARTFSLELSQDN